MKDHRRLCYAVVVALALIALAAVNRAGQAAESKQKSYDSPNLVDGKTPDFRGVWQARETVYVNIEGHPAQDGIAASKTVIVDTPDGKIPYKPEALAKRNANYTQRLTADPSSKCYQAGVPRATYQPAPLQIVQSPGNMAIAYQENHAYRLIYPTSRPHFDGIDWWMGDSRGHWEGNTLVVDVTDLNDEAWFDAAGNHHSDNMHVVERYALLSRNVMQYEARFEDPDTFTQPWTMRLLLYRNTKPGAHLIEDECLEDANNVRHHILPSDPNNVSHHDFGPFRSSTDAADVAALLKADAEAPQPDLHSGTNLAKAANFTAPRTPDGHADLQGIWAREDGRGGFNGIFTGALNGNPVSPGAGRGAGGPAAGTTPARGDGGGNTKGTGRGGFDARPITATNVAGTTSEGPPYPYLPAAYAEAKFRRDHDMYGDPEAHCHLPGLPRGTAGTTGLYPFQIIQDEKNFSMFFEYVHTIRIVPEDNSKHPSNYWAWMGDSRGHWQGDTFVVDVANFNGRPWVGMNGNVTDENEHVIEKYTLVSPNTMRYEMTITDPTVFYKPWHTEYNLLRLPDQFQVLEYSCLEGERDTRHYTEADGGKQKAPGAK